MQHAGHTLHPEPCSCHGADSSDTRWCGGCSNTNRAPFMHGDRGWVWNLSACSVYHGALVECYPAARSVAWHNHGLLLMHECPHNAQQCKGAVELNGHNRLRTQLVLLHVSTYVCDLAARHLAARRIGRQLLSRLAVHDRNHLR